VIIAGGGRVGFQIAQVLKRLGLQFVIVELDHRRVEQAKEAGMTVVYGDVSQEIVLDAAGIKDSSQLIVTIPGIVEARATIIQAQRLNNKIEIVARTSSSEYFDVLKNLGVSVVILPEFEASLEMTHQSLLRLHVPSSEIQRYTDTVRQELCADWFSNNHDYRILSHFRGAEKQFDLQWISLSPESPIVDKSIGEIGVRKKTGASVVGVIRDETLNANPDAHFVFRCNDWVAIIGSESNRESFAKMASPVKLGTDPDLLNLDGSNKSFGFNREH